MHEAIDPIRRMSFTITHASGEEIEGQFTCSPAATSVTWSLNGNPPREVAALTVDLRTAIEAVIEVYNQDGDDACRDLYTA
jgi:hypothetical protein